MKILYTVHARLRMQKRKISFKEVELALQHPDTVELGSIVTYKKIFDFRVLVVVARYHQGNQIIISAYKSSNVRKHFRSP